ncbi:MAG: DUF2927 domain-containing protein [Mariniphaga sp.]|nr:DUF2927 domain-containing protein [Mariniphaga sp.]
MRPYYFLFICFVFFVQCKPNLTKEKIEKVKNNFTIEELEYFSDVVFNSDFSNKKTKLKRWKSNVNIGLYGEYSALDSLYIKEIIDLINNIVESVELNFVSYKDANLKVYFTDYNNFKNFSIYAEMGTHGYANYKWNIFEGIKEGYVLINKKLEGDSRKRVIKEEITQSLGLTADSYKYPSSIFYQLMSENHTYADIDIKLIQLLYNYNLPIGMTEQEFKDIFLKDE